MELRGAELFLDEREPMLQDFPVGSVGDTVHSDETWPSEDPGLPNQTLRLDDPNPLCRMPQGQSGVDANGDGNDHTDRRARTRCLACWPSCLDRLADRSRPERDLHLARPGAGH